MSTRNNLLGVLALERDKLNGFDVADVDLVKTVAQQLSIAIERAQQIEELAFRSTVAAQTAWASEIAHEINNQIGNIMGWAYLLRNNLKEETKLRKFAEKIEASISILSNAGPWSDQPSQLFKLDEFLEHDLKKLINQQNLTDEFHLGAQNIYVQVSPIKLQHVFRHLVRNAARAMDKSKVKKLIVRTEVINDNTVEIMLQDTGPGLTKEAQLSIFHRPYSTKNRGGHGLLFVRQMVEDMQGQIKHVPQKNSRGAVFSIRLPIASRMDGAVE
jgi:signal transduction histidine kinase